MKKEHFEILLEDVKSKLDLVLEGHQVLDGKINNLSEELAFVKQDVAGVKQDVAGVKQEVIILKHEVADVRHELLDTKEFLINYLNKVDTVLNEHERKFKVLGV